MARSLCCKGVGTRASKPQTLPDLGRLRASGVVRRGSLSVPRLWSKTGREPFKTRRHGHHQAIAASCTFSTRGRRAVRAVPAGRSARRANFPYQGVPGPLADKLAVGPRLLSKVPALRVGRGPWTVGRRPCGRAVPLDEALCSRTNPTTATVAQALLLFLC